MNPLDTFFNLGSKVTNNDPVKKADFDYYLLWIMFLAFFSILISNLWDFYINLKLANLGWAFVMFAILYFQYWGLKGAYEVRKILKQPPIKNESKEEMLHEFENKKD